MAHSPDPRPETPARRGPAWGKIIGFSCGGCMIWGLILGLVLAFVGYRAVHELMRSTPLPPSQRAYTGDWQGSDGTTISIRADGTGDYRSGSNYVTGGRTTINDSARTLEIGLFGIKRTWRIDQPPRTVGGFTRMKLNGILFRRTAGSNP